METVFPVQPGVRPPCDGSDDLHDGDGQPTPGARRLHAPRAECPSWALHPQPRLLPSLHTCAGSTKSGSANF